MKKLFIGRKKTLSDIRKDIFVQMPGEGHCHSIMGANDIGKTTLVKKWIEEFEASEHPNIYCIPTEFIASATYWTFWAELIQLLADEIPETALAQSPNPEQRYIDQILDAYRFFDDDDLTAGLSSDSYNPKATRHLNRIFTAYTRLGLHIILIIDEFDRARQAFPEENDDGGFFQRLFSLTEKGASTYNLTILLISRRRVGTIAHHMADGSDFESAFPPKALKGFDDDELEEYFSTYADLPVGIPDEETKKAILYFCGRHPGLLLCMRRAAEHLEKGLPLNIQNIFEENHLEIHKFYTRMARLLKEEYINRERTLNCIGTFAQIFIGPAYDKRLPERMQRIENYGFISRAYQQNIFQLAGIDDCNTYGVLKGYEPLSPYFVEYVRTSVIPEELDEGGKLINQTELNVRKMILDVLKKAYPDDWNSRLDTLTNSVKQKYMASLNDLALKNNAEIRNVTYTILDVLSFTDYASIITFHWELMKPYLQSFESPKQLKNAFFFLKEVRNCSQHLNPQILDEESYARLYQICKTLNEDFELGYADKKRPSSAAPAVLSPPPATTEENLTAPSEQEIRHLMQQKVFFHFMSKSKAGSFRGYIEHQGKNFKANISKVTATQSQLTPETARNIQVRVEKWDPNPTANSFIVIPIQKNRN